MPDNKSPYILAAALVLSSGMASADVRLHAEDRTLLQISDQGLYPEGIEYDAERERFLLGSIRRGEVVAVQADGSTTRLVEDDRLRSVVGIRVDAARGRLLVTSSDYGVAERSTPEDRFQTAALGIYDIETGRPLQFVNLSSLRPGEDKFVNDLAVDAEGNTYLTDSLAAAIYRVSPDGRAELFLTHEDFRGPGFNLNGIAVHPEGYLLVVKKSEGALFRIPLDEPESFTRVTLSPPLPAPDGIVLADDTHLVVITNRAGETVGNAIHLLRTDDGWSTASVVETRASTDTYATTGVVANGRIVVSHGNLHTLGATLENGTPLDEGFRLQEIGLIE